MYLEERPWILWDQEHASFSSADYEEYLGRLKNLPAFDEIEIGRKENGVFGTCETDGEHFTDFSIEHDPFCDQKEVSDRVKKQLYLLNPFMHLSQGKGTNAEHWWIRMGTKETGFACPIDVCLALKLEDMGMNVNFRLVWDGGHCAEDDLDAQIHWIREITGKDKK